MKINRYLTFVVLAMCSVSLSAGNFSVDKSVSEVAVDAKASPPHSFTSVVTAYQYDIEIDPETLAVSRADFKFNFSDMDSDEAKRDKKMRKWMDVALHPEARFELKEVVERGGEAIGVGTFFMHGVSREIEVPFTVSREGDSVILDGGTTFDYKDWNLEIIRMLIFSVKPQLKPRFHLVGRLEQGK